MTARKVALIILDGWGHGKHPAADAIYQANAPFVKSLYATVPNTELLTHGNSVGLPEGQMGNSEVGHMNIGAGRIVYQELMRINKKVESGELQQSEVLKQTFEYCKKNDKPLHLMGLVSDGGVHSNNEHLHALIRYAREAGVKNVFVHAFTDGRDTDPYSGVKYLTNLLEVCYQYDAQLVSVVGRYYAMDRDNRWERVRKAYDLLVRGIGVPTSDIISAVQASYHARITDEFIEPIAFTKDGVPQGRIRPGDAVMVFNFRTDRCRQITNVLTQQDLPDHGMLRQDLYYVTMTMYDRTFKNVHNIFSSDDVHMTLGQVLAANDKTQLRIAETEKYPHVTFFFNGGREVTFEGETRVLIPSPKVPTYDMKPEMSAFEVKDAVVKEIKSEKHDFICLNFANPDMVGHTGVKQAIVKAIEAVDKCVAEVVEAARQHGYAVLLTADHGNADCMMNEDGSPNTAHTTNPVPLFYIDDSITMNLRKGILADIAPTVLQIMQIPQPPEMTGSPLLSLPKPEYAL